MPKEPRVKSTHCKQCPLRKDPCYRKLEADELAFIETFKTGELVIEAGEQVLIDG